MKTKTVTKAMLTLLLTSVLVSWALPVKNVYAESVYMQNRTWFGGLGPGYGDFWRDSGWQTNVAVSDSYAYDYTSPQGDRTYVSLNLVSSGDYLKGNVATSWYAPLSEPEQEFFGWGRTRASTESVLYFNVWSGTSGYGLTTVFMIVTWHITGKLQSAASVSPYFMGWAVEQANASFFLAVEWLTEGVIAPSINWAEEAGVTAFYGESRVEEKPIEITKTAVIELYLFGGNYLVGPQPFQGWLGFETDAMSEAGGFGSYVGSTSSASALADWDVSVTVAPDPRNPDIIIGPPKPPEALSLDLTIVHPGTNKLTADGASQIALLATAKKGGKPEAGVNLVFDTNWPEATARLSSTTATTNETGQATVTFTAPDGFTHNAPSFGYRNIQTLEKRQTSSPGFIRSASFDIVVRDVEGTASARKNITIFQTPVLLVHGGWSSPSTWDKMDPFLQDEGFYVERMKYDWKESITKTGSFDLPGWIWNVKQYFRAQDVTIKKVDIVAHSEGGLLARYYTTLQRNPYPEASFEGGYNDDVRKLLMMGTPHLGIPLLENDDFLALYRWWFGEISASIYEMQPNSAVAEAGFLRVLNSVPPRSDVEHFAIVGTKNSIPGWAQLNFFGYEFVSPLTVWPDGDGLVSISSQSHQFKYKPINASHIQETSSPEAFGIIYNKLAREPFCAMYAPCPINLLVTDPLGRRVGFDMATGSTINEVPEAFYTGPISTIEDPQGVIIPNPAIGQYKIEAFGVASGSFTISTTFMDANGIIPNQKEFTGRVSAGDRFEYSIVLTPYNRPPIAGAGLDRTVEGNTHGGALVTLDGTGSSDPDGDPLTYLWSGDFGTETGATPTVFLTLGDHTITIVVNDGKTNSEPDTVTIGVVDTTPPSVALINPPAGYALQNGVTFSIDAQDTVSDITGVTLSIRDASGNPIGFEDLPATFDSASGEWSLRFDTLKLPDGFYTAIAKATDSSGNVGTSPTVPYSIRNWAVIELLPASENNKAGRTMPVKFALRVAASDDSNQPFVYNEELMITIYDKNNPGNILQTSTYGTTARDYRINDLNELYITNFQTLKTPTTYMVQIYRKEMQIGTFEFKTVM